MKLNEYDKQNIGAAVAEPFSKLAEHIDGSTTTKLAMRVFEKEVAPSLEELRMFNKDLFDRLPRGQYLTYESPKRPPTAGRYRSYRTSGNKVIQFPDRICKTFGTSQRNGVPLMEGIVIHNNWDNSSGEPVVTQAKMTACAKESEIETVTKAHGLRRKAVRSAELIKVFLVDFTMPEQIPYSLPQLSYFLSRLDFRKRNTWGTKPPMKTQKRPKVVVVPSDELRQLVMEATMLAESTKNMKGEGE